MVVDSPEPEPQSAHDLMNQTEAELAADAAKYSKQSMSDADRTFFTQFFIKQRKELCVQAIERGVSMPMVDRYLGRRMAIKKPNRWNRFMKTTGARAVFRGRQKGVKHRPAMGGVSDLYWELSPEERASFADRPPPETLIPADYPNEHHTAEEESIAAEAERGQRQTISFKRASDHVQNFMESWVQQAVHVAKSCNCEMVFFAVSRHLGPHLSVYSDYSRLCKYQALPDKGPTGIGKGSHVLTSC
ncbi:hypothetical protein PtB15_3B337 [Puccinia triticina]|nr:hypothetical protein PtB15_3B337 [Puccinia triticina]